MNNKEAIKNFKTKAKESLRSLKGNKTALSILGVTGIALTGVAADAGCVNIGTNNAINDGTRPTAIATDSNFDKLGIKRLDLGESNIQTKVQATPQTPCSSCERKVETQKSYYPSAETSNNNGQFVSFSAGEVKNVPAGTIISGDIEVNGQVLYDNDENTALVVELPNSASVRAPWGASGTENVPSNVLDQKAEEMAQQIRNTRPNVTVQIVRYQDGQTVNPGYQTNYLPRTNEATINNDFAVKHVNAGERYYLRNDIVTIIVGDTRIVNRDNGQLVMYDDSDLTGQIVVSKGYGITAEFPFAGDIIETTITSLMDSAVIEAVNAQMDQMIQSGRTPIVSQIEGQSVILNGYDGSRPDYYWPNRDPRPNLYRYPHNPLKHY